MMRKYVMAFAQVQQQFETYLYVTGLAPHTIKSYLRDMAAFVQWLALRRAAETHMLRLLVMTDPSAAHTG